MRSRSPLNAPLISCRHAIPVARYRFDDIINEQQSWSFGEMGSISHPKSRTLHTEIVFGGNSFILTEGRGWMVAPFAFDGVGAFGYFAFRAERKRFVPNFKAPPMEVVAADCFHVGTLHPAEVAFY